MIADAALQFSNAQALTSSAPSSYYADMGGDRDIGTGRRMFILLTVNTTFADPSNNASVTVTLQGSEDTSFGSPVDQILFTIPALAQAGEQFWAAIDPGKAGNCRYWQLYYTVNNENLSAGAVTAEMTKDAAAYTAYKKGYAIS